MEKLNWVWQDRVAECHAEHRGLRIRAVQDDSPENPFENWDGLWPIAIYYAGSIKVYEKTKGVPIRDVLSRFNDGHLIHDQIAIASALGTTVFEATSTLDRPTNYHRDAAELRWAFEQAIGDVSDSVLLDVYEELYKLLGIPCYKTTSTGYCQGDWAEVLVVATPEAIAEFGVTEVTEKDLEATADLYGYWAWGNVYGYVIEQRVTSHDNDEEEDDEEDEFAWEEISGGSCWGFYGDDFTESGLEEAARDAADAHLAELGSPHCRTVGCLNDPDTGEGWDGYCGSCADSKEKDAA